MNDEIPDEDDEVETDDDIAEGEEETAEATDAPETSEETENLVKWDEPPGSTGRRAPEIIPEDEVSPGEASVREGMEEADREQRIAADDEADMEP